ncbi:MAG: hypothetical protein Tsb005_15000 [Gammaproteobacteria bacterium]
MSGLHTAQAYTVRRQALLEARRFFTTTQQLADAIYAKRSQVSQWINDADIRIPYEYALLIEEKTGVSIERLIAHNNFAARKAATLMIQRLRSNESKRVIKIKLNRIKDNLPCLYPLSNNFDLQNNVGTALKYDSRYLVVDTDLNLLADKSTFLAYQTNNTPVVPCIVLDINALLLGLRAINFAQLTMTLTEKTLLGAMLEKTIGSRQGQRSDLKINAANNVDDLPLRRVCTHVEGKTDAYVAELVGLVNRDRYLRIKKVIKHGIPELIYALDQHHVSPYVAAQWAKLSPAKQLAQLQQSLAEKSCNRAVINNLCFEAGN